MRTMKEVKDYLEKNKEKYEFIRKAKVGELVSAPKDIAEQIDNDLCTRIGKELQDVEIVLNESYQRSGGTDIKIYR